MYPQEKLGRPDAVPDILIYVDGQSRVLTDVQFFDPVKGFIQTEHAMYIPKELI